MSNLTYFERQKIEFYLRCKQGVRDIGRRLKRDHTVILREIKRNSGNYSPYSAENAQHYAGRRAKKTNKRKLEKDPNLLRYVSCRLEADQSPEQIAGRIKEHPPPELRGKTISHESIYQYIYNTIEGKYLYHCFRRKKRPKRQKRYSRKKHERNPLVERVSIHERPEEINIKQRYGDWESDTLVFRKQKQALSVQYERKSMLLRINKVQNRTSEETEQAITKSIESLPEHLWKSMTFDNGGEGACHRKIKKNFGIQTYFCDAYCSWQKGGVENINGLVRQYLPKSTDMSRISDKDVHIIQETLNNRPRKSLGYRTPNEVLEYEFNVKSGALNS